MSQSFERLFLVSQIDGTVSLQRAINPTSNAEWLGTGVCVCVCLCVCVCVCVRACVVLSVFGSMVDAAGKLFFCL